MTDPKKPARPARAPVPPPQVKQTSQHEALPEAMKKRPLEQLNLAKHVLKGH
jgi:hypothetical protein